MKTLEEAKVIARCSDPDWVGEELFRLQELSAARDRAVDALEDQGEQLLERVRALRAGLLEWRADVDDANLDDGWIIMGRIDKLLALVADVRKGTDDEA